MPILIASLIVWIFIAGTLLLMRSNERAFRRSACSLLKGYRDLLIDFLPEDHPLRWRLVREKAADVTIFDPDKAAYYEWWEAEQRREAWEIANSDPEELDVH